MGAVADMGNTAGLEYSTVEVPLYIIIEKGYPEIKYQFHFPSNQFMNADDESIEPFSELFDLNPNLAEFFRPLLLQSWDLDPNIQFNENISITLNDNDFYDIFFWHSFISYEIIYFVLIGL